MQVKDLIPSAYLKATGLLYTGVSGDSDWNKLLGIANMYVTSWAHEPNAQWSSLYQLIQLGTVTATDTFDLDSSIIELSNDPSDRLEILQTDGQIAYYETVKPQKLRSYPYGNYCARAGASIVFNQPFTSDESQFGGTITIGAYVAPDPLVKDTDFIPVDNPIWLMLISAAEWTRTDNTLAQNYPSLVAEANDAMVSMKMANNAQVEKVQLSQVARGANW